MNKQTTTTLAAIIATSVAAFAGTSTKNVKTLETKSDPFVTGVIGVEVASGYVNKGRVFDSSAVYQPFAAIVIPTKLELGGVKVSVIGSTKQNIHAASPINGLSRSEYNAGLLLNKDRVTLTSTYEWVSSDNNWFPDAQGVNVGLSFDDRGLTPLAMNPYAKGYFGTKRVGQPLGNYYEVGVAPSISVAKTTVGFPVAVGFGNRSFFSSGERYGYTSAGISTSTPLASNVSLTTGVTYFNTNTSSSGKSDFWLTSAGLVLKF